MRSAIEALEPRRHFASGTILFLRGADRSGGFLEATNDAQRTEQLADLNNRSTAGGNHGWATLAAQLRGEGYTVVQQIEPLEANAPSTGQTKGSAYPLIDANLLQYDAIVMASNNADYATPYYYADNLDKYVRSGHGVLFISDGNFGSSWADAPSSDNVFLSRFGMAFNQDNGQYTLSRSAGDFADAGNPLLFGVDAFDGEGVSPVRLAATPPSGVTVNRVVGARGTTYDNNPASTANNSRGTARPVDGRDASLATAFAGSGRVAAFFDRNTFFNANGAGTDITNNDNARLATNLFGWLTDQQPPAVTSSGFVQSVAQGSPRRLTFRLDDNLNGTLTRSDIRLRNRRTGVAIPGASWRLSVVDGDGFSDVTIRIDGEVAAGPYQLQIPRGAIADDSNVVRAGAIRYAFTILPAVQAQRVTSATASGSVGVTSGWQGLYSNLVGLDEDKV